MASLSDLSFNQATGIIKPATGPSATRPSNPGTVRVNSTSSSLEVRNSNIYTGFGSDSRFGSGRDGTASVSGIINSYAYMTTGFRSSANNSADFNTVTGFEEGQKVLIIQSQDGTLINNVGNFEEKTIQSISGTTVTFTENFTQDYNANSGANTRNSRQVQMVNIKEYDNLTLSGNITAKDWDGRSGGIIAFKVRGILNCNGNTVDASESGYRGGAYGPGNDEGGFSGEGRAGVDTSRASSATPQSDFIAGGGGAGGPAASLGGCGAGGGSYATAGGNGTRNTGGVIAVPGSTYGREDLVQELHFGGAGGGGGDNDNQGGSPVTAGPGGGIIFCQASFITAGRFNANGKTHIQSAAQGGCGPAVNGSGAGGSVWIKSRGMQLVSCTANGGARVLNSSDCGGDGQFHPNGGAGGDGRIRLDGAIITGSSSPAQYSGAL